MKPKMLVGLTLFTAIFCLTASAATVNAASSDPTSLVARVAALESAVATLQGQVAALQSALAAANNVLALSPYVAVDTTKKLVLFTGVNLQLVNGTNVTASHNGLGNLILGYDLPRDDGRYFCSLGYYTDPTVCAGNSETWAVSHKSGSHYLVIGDRNNYSQWGGLVVGNFNTSSAPYASVTGGENNTASGYGASVSGGGSNAATFQFATVSGGFENNSTSFAASVSGGRRNNATDCDGPSVSGGTLNTASGCYASVSGGSNNTASGVEASVSGGFSRSAGGGYNWAAGGLFEAQ